jgi:nitroreductase
MPDDARDPVAGARTASGGAGSVELAFGVDAPLHEVMSSTRAMRRLRPDPVARELLVSLVEAATWAPTGGNGQAFSWVIVTDREVLGRLDPLWRECYELYIATIATITPDTMDAGQRERMYRAVAYQRDHFTQIPALLVACYDLSEQRRRLVAEWRGAVRAARRVGLRHALQAARRAPRGLSLSEAASVYPGVQNVLLSARALGLGATLTTLHLALESEFKKVLGIPRSVNTFALIPVGYPLGRFGPVRRRPVEEAIHWDRW